MSDTKTQAGLYNLTAPVAITFSDNLFVAKAFGKKGKEVGEAKYSANFLFPADHPDIMAMKKIAAQVAEAKWPGRIARESALRKAGTPPAAENALKFPFSSGTKLADKRKLEGKDGEYQRDMIVIAARSKYEPALAGIENGKAVDYTGDARAAAKSKFYSGAMVFAQFNFVAYDGVGNNPPGVTAYLNSVFTTGKGAKLKTGSGPSAAEQFSQYAGVATGEDPTAGMAGMDDDISF